MFAFIAFFAVGPGVCVWLALSELMPTRIRSNGMSIALLINQLVSTTIAAVFLPTVGNYGYSAMFFFWSACTVIYFLTAAFLLPETKGKTLEEIEAHFRGETGAEGVGTSRTATMPHFAPTVLIVGDVSASRVSGSGLGDARGTRQAGSYASRRRGGGGRDRVRRIRSRGYRARAGLSRPDWARRGGPAAAAVAAGAAGRPVGHVV